MLTFSQFTTNVKSNCDVKEVGESIDNFPFAPMLVLAYAIYKTIISEVKKEKE